MSSWQGQNGAVQGDRREDSSLATLVRRHALVVLLTAAAAAAVAGGVSHRQEVRYESSAQLQFRALGPEYQVIGLRTTPTGDDETAQAAADVVSASSPGVAALAARRGAGGMSADAIRSHVRVSGAAGTRIVTVTASAQEPARAARLANNYARAVRELRRRLDDERAGAALRALRAQYDALPRWQQRSDTGRQLREQLQGLQTLQRIGTGSPQLLRPAEASAAPVAPKTRRNIVLGALFGLVAGLGIALLRGQSDRRLRHRGHVQAAYDLPMLGEIPRHRALGRHREFAQLPRPVAEAFGLLQANVRYAPGDVIAQRLLVTSAARSEGTSTVAWNLAAAGAAAGRRVMLIEVDLRHPILAKRHGLEASPGLAEVLAGDVPLSEALQVVPVIPGSAHNGEGSQHAMHVLVAGNSTQGASRLLQAPGLAALHDRACHAHDLVVVDAPPLTAVADAVPFARLADGVVVVARVGVATDHEAARLRHQLDVLRAPPIGVVANGVAPAETATVAGRRS